MSAPMVRALLDDRKTVTRRVIKYIPALGLPEEWGPKIGTPKFERIVGDYSRYAPVKPGETVYVKERWQNNPVGVGAIYAADYEGEKPAKGWKPSLFMPEIASRIRLRITSVTAERLQDISGEDVDAEFLGENYPQDVLPELFPRSGSDFDLYGDLSLQQIYARLWDSLNAARGYPWESNPWVWRIEFKVLT